MPKRGLIHLIATVFMLLVSMILLIIPGEVGTYIQMFLPVLFFSVLAGVSMNAVSGVLIGFLAPAILYLVLHKTSFRADVIYQMISYAGAAFIAAIIYRIFKSSIGAAILAVLGSRILLLISRLIGHYVLTTSYTLFDYFEEAVKSCYPGLLLTLIIIPLLILLFRKRGLMKILRNEEED